MTLDRLGRWRLPVLAVLSLAIAIGLVAVILLAGRAPTAFDGSQSPRAPTPTPSNSVAPGDTPESAVRAFFEAFARARETDDPSLIEPYVTGTDSSAYQTAAGFLEGQRGQGKASVVTVQELSEFEVTLEDSTATVLFTLREGGYDIDLDTGEPLESPVVLTERRVQATLARSGDRWLLERYGAVE
jgi:hypothetical protein